MASKTSKFSSMLATPSRSEASAKTMVLQNILEGDSPEYQYIKADIIEFNPLNDYSANDSDEDIRELAEDIRRNGLLHNIVVSYTSTGTYRLLSGERRLRAYRLLYEETKESKYASIYALVRKGLSEIEEVIILDAANLQARNAASDEKRYRKATARFVENLKSKYNISDEEAIRLAKQQASVQGVVIEKNIVLETDLNSDLLSLLDEGYISKNQAYEYARLPAEVQRVVADGLLSAKDKGTAELKRVNADLVTPAKNIRLLDESLASQQHELEEIEEEEKEVKEQLAEAESDEAEALRQRAEELKQQKKQQKKLIKNTQQELSENVDNLQNQVADVEQEEVRTVAGEAAMAELSTLIDDVDRATSPLREAGLEEKIGYLAETDKAALHKKMSKLASEMSRLAKLLK